jgi:hypothetical protein
MREDQPSNPFSRAKRETKRTDVQPRDPSRAIRPPAAVDELYAKPDDDWLSEEEIREEELKKLIQSDAIRAYGFIRRRVIEFIHKAQRVFARLWRFKLPSMPRWAVRSLQTAAATALLAVVVLNVFPGVKRFVPGLDNNVLGEGTSRPGFDVLKPAGVTDGDIAIAYDSTKQSASYQQIVNEVRFTVSQQPLPEEFQANPANSIQKLALSLSDKRTINQLESNKGILYVAEAQDGVQTGIFSYENLLFFVKTPSPQPIALWIEFINSLQ